MYMVLQRLSQACVITPQRCLIMLLQNLFVSDFNNELWHIFVSILVTNTGINYKFYFSWKLLITN